MMMMIMMSLFGQLFYQMRRLIPFDDDENKALYASAHFGPKGGSRSKATLSPPLD
jgi:hypothetical protein